MSNPRAEIGRVDRDVPANLRYINEREASFKALLTNLQRITDGLLFVNQLPASAEKYSKFLSVSDREPLMKAVADWIKNFLNPIQKQNAWAKILSVVMSSGANRCDVNSPGLNEVTRLIPLSPFKFDSIVAHVTAFALISPNKILQPIAHHEDYQKVRRLVYEAVVKKGSGVDLLMGAEYFVVGRTDFDDLNPCLQSYDINYVLEVVKPIDRRG